MDDSSSFSGLPRCERSSFFINFADDDPKVIEALCFWEDVAFSKYQELCGRSRIYMQRSPDIKLFSEFEVINIDNLLANGINNLVIFKDEFKDNAEVDFYQPKKGDRIKKTLEEFAVECDYSIHNCGLPYCREYPKFYKLYIEGRWGGFISVEELKSFKSRLDNPDLVEHELINKDDSISVYIDDGWDDGHPSKRLNDYFKKEWIIYGAIQALLWYKEDLLSLITGEVTLDFDYSTDSSVIENSGFDWNGTEEQLNLLYEKLKNNKLIEDEGFELFKNAFLNSNGKVVWLSMLNSLAYLVTRLRGVDLIEKTKITKNTYAVFKLKKKEIKFRSLSQLISNIDHAPPRNSKAIDEIVKNLTKTMKT